MCGCGTDDCVVSKENLVCRIYSTNMVQLQSKVKRDLPEQVSEV